MKKTSSAFLKYGLLIAVFMTLASANAWAQDQNLLNYVRLSSGFYQPSDDLDDAGYDPGLDMSLLFGRYFGKHLVIEGGLGLLYTENDVLGNTPSAGFYIEEDRVGILSVTATAKGVYPIGRWEVFGGAGIGAYLVGFDADVTTSNLGDVDTDDEDAVFGFHVVSGFCFNLTERFLLGAEVKYLWTDKVEISKRISDIPIQLQGDLDGLSVGFTFGFRF